jgi:hypothetical protein
MVSDAVPHALKRLEEFRTSPLSGLGYSSDDYESHKLVPTLLF